MLFGGCYLAAPVLRYLQKRRRHWITRLKTNRVLIIGGRKMKPGEWEAEAAKGRVAPLNRSLVAHLAGWGTVRVTASRLKADGTVRFLAASNTN